MLVPLTPYDEASEPNRRAWSVLRTLSVPHRYAHAEHDWGVGDRRSALRDGVLGAREIVIEKAGHFVQEKRGAELAEVIETFIRSTPLPVAEERSHA